MSDSVRARGTICFIDLRRGPFSSVSARVTADRDAAYVHCAESSGFVAFRSQTDLRAAPWLLCSIACCELRAKAARSTVSRDIRHTGRRQVSAVLTVAWAD